MSQPAEGLRRRLREIHLRLSGNLDRAEPLPPPTGLQARLLPVADLVLVLLYSRSRAGSLRSVPVTLTTIGLSAGIFLAAGAAAIALLASALSPFRPLLLAAALAAVVLAAGAGVLALFGLLQRRTIRTRGGAR